MADEVGFGVWWVVAVVPCAAPPLFEIGPCRSLVGVAEFFLKILCLGFLLVGLVIFFV